VYLTYPCLDLRRAFELFPDLTPRLFAREAVRLRPLDQDLVVGLNLLIQFRFPPVTAPRSSMMADFIVLTP
jgi:hypothetical protein